MAKILVVEDSPDIRALIRMLLEAKSHEVSEVPDGRAAIAAARELSPDLVLMDLSLPVLSGWEATQQIRSDPATASIPIVAVTAHAMEGDRERALAAGCDGFIAKPIDEGTFAARIESHLNARRPASIEPDGRSNLPGSGPGRVLVVDDQRDVAELLRQDLEAEGHEVLVAESARRALELFRERDGRFDLCVIDVILGGETGYALTDALTREAAEYIPILLVTAGTIDRERGYDVGADDFIGKPIETAELRVRARSLIRLGRLVREQRRIGRERSEAYSKLSELDRMRSDFLSTVSHELRTPLNTIVLLAHQLEKGAEEDAAQRATNLRFLLEAAESLRRLIDNILDLAKLEAGQRDLHARPVSVPELLRENANLVEPQARAKGLKLVVEADPGLPASVRLDPEKVSRVLVNLLSNAVKYTDSGTITLRAEPWQTSTTFEVRDTGRGIPRELIAAAFEPFKRIRPATGESPQGTGLGLTISKQLVEIMGGDLILDSREGEGTRVQFTLPELPPGGPQAAASEEPPQSVSPLAGGGGLVLIVEDDYASRYGLGTLLQSEGYEVEEAANLKEADALLDRRAPSVVLLDITLPDGDGAAWLSRHVERDPDFPPVIALTGMTADEDTRRVAKAGVRGVLTKPVNVARLLVALRAALGESR